MRPKIVQSATRALVAIVCAAALCISQVPTVAGAASGPPTRPPRDPVRTATGGGTEVPGQVIVKLRPGTSKARVAAAHADANVAARIDTLRMRGGYQVVTLKGGVSVSRAIARYEAEGGVAYAQPDFVYHTVATVPNDERFGDQWGMLNTGQTAGTPGDDIHATEAWDVTTGTAATVVAVVDTGVDYDHPDLAPNMWVNPAPTKGDIHGYDFVNDDSDPMDDNGHGTHCAGIVGAKGDNTIGVAGVSWNTRIMALKCFDSDGHGDTLQAIQAIDYANTHGADVISNSWGGGNGGGYDQALKDVIDASAAVVVCSAGNGRSDNDTSAFYPASYDSPQLVAVAATDEYDELAEFSNWGATSVDVGAPGVGILSTQPGRPEVTPTVDPPLFSDDVADLGDWHNETASPAPQFGLSGDRYVSAPYSIAATSWSDDSQGGYTDSTGLDLTSASDQVLLRLDANWDLNQGDGSSIMARSDQQGWVTLWSSHDTSSGGWKRLDIPMSQFAGDTNVVLSLELEPWSGQPSGPGQGQFWDDVRVLKATRTGGGDYADAYQYLSGTSMAAPHVAGLAALIKSRTPWATNVQIKDLIIESADKRAWLNGKCVSGGRVNAAAALEAPQPARTVECIEGADRYATAIAASRSTFTTGACDAALVATGRNYPDALAAAGLAGAADCPILLVNGVSATPDAPLVSELRRVTSGRPAATVYLVGGTAAVSAGIESSLKKTFGATHVMRVAGASRYVTAEEIAKRARIVMNAKWITYSGRVIVVTGANYADALLAGPVAYRAHMPVLLVGSSLDSAFKPTLTAIGAKDAMIIGSMASVSSSVQSALGKALGGAGHVTRPCAVANPYSQGVAVADWGTASFGLSWSGVGLATGENYPDALAAGPALGAAGAPLVFTHTNALDAVVASKLTDHKAQIGRVRFFGGTSAVSQGVRDAVSAALR